MNEHERHVLRAARDKVRIQRDGKSVEISREEALIYKNHDLAFKGSVNAVRNATLQIAKATAAEAVEIAEECALWSAIKERQIKALKRAAQSGTVSQRVLPHPDDIFIDHRTGVRIVGPVDEDDWPRFNQWVRLRDTLYVQHAMEDFDNAYPARGPTTPSTPLILAMLQNLQLPPSLKLSVHAENERVWELRRMSRREALKACRAAWRGVGQDIPRGKRMMATEVLIALFGILRDFVADAGSAGESPAALDEAIDRTIRRLAREVPWPKRQDQTVTLSNSKEHKA